MRKNLPKIPNTSTELEILPRISMRLGILASVSKLPMKLNQTVKLHTRFGAPLTIDREAFYSRASEAGREIMKHFIRQLRI